MIAFFLPSLVVALSGAMAPGPLLTYTIMQTMQQKQHGYLVGLWVIIGHAVLEGILILLILSGAAFFFSNALFCRIVGPLGGLFLAYLGATLLRDVLRHRVQLAIPQAKVQADPANQSTSQDRGTFARFNHPILAGFFVSMSNPYWWAWWAGAGLSLMMQLQLSFRQWPNLATFFLGHETGDLLWYLLVSVLVFTGRHWLTDRLYRIILLGCSIVMIGFGLYLGINPFLSH